MVIQDQQAIQFIAVIDEDWPVLNQFSKYLADEYFPEINQKGIRRVFSGYPTFTPDGRFIIGPTKKIGGFVMAGGCNAHGVSGSAGIGKFLVESILEKNPSEYVKSLSPDRFLDTSIQWDKAEEQARGIYQTYYDLIPQFQPKDKPVGDSGKFFRKIHSFTNSDAKFQSNTPTKLDSKGNLWSLLLIMLTRKAP